MKLDLMAPTENGTPFPQQMLALILVLPAFVLLFVVRPLFIGLNKYMAFCLRFGGAQD